MMLFIFGYLIPLLIMAVVITCFMFKDIKERSPDITYGALVFSAAVTLTPVLNVACVLGCIVAGVAYIWDEYSGRSVFK